MLNITNYGDSASLLKAIEVERTNKMTLMNPNPVVQVVIWVDSVSSEYYVSHVSWNHISNNWMCSIDFRGFSNQLEPYWTHEGCRAFTNLKLLCHSLLTMASAGPSRIHLTTSKWNKINKGENPNGR